VKAVLVVTSVDMDFLTRMILVDKQTFAISSLFLNSPFTSVTFPPPSNSVQRSFSSFAGRKVRPRLVLSSRKSESGGRSSGCKGALDFLGLLKGQKVPPELESLLALRNEE